MHEREPSFEQEPTYSFPWHEDAYGPYLTFRTDEGDFTARPETTLMYLFPDQPEADHIFIFTHEDEQGQIFGARIWRRMFDEALGEAAFGQLCDQMFERGFDVADDEEPSPLDIQDYENTFGEPYIKPNPIDKIVELALRNFDDAWRYYSEEWSA